MCSANYPQAGLYSIIHNPYHTFIACDTVVITSLNVLTDKASLFSLMQSN